MLVHKTAIVVPDWDALRRDDDAYRRFITDAQGRADEAGLIVFSCARTAASPIILRDEIPLSFVADTSILSEARLQYLTGQKRRASVTPRFGLIMSNGYGLGHVARMQSFGEALKNYGPVAFQSYSAALQDGAFYLPSAQYLGLPDEAARRYGREASLQFFNAFRPTHILYDGNVLPSGLLSALAARPEIHLTWIRRGQWRSDTAPKFMAQQALADLVIEPGDVSDIYDAGPTWNERYDYCPARLFLKTKPIRPHNPAFLERDEALKSLKLDPLQKYVLLMPGAMQTSDGVVHECVEAVRSTGAVPVIAHWPMSHDKPPTIDGAIILERMPIAQFYRGFTAIISAAGYNAFHELLSCGVPTIFIPQEDSGRDAQLARAEWAVDHGYAALCRRSALGLLPHLLNALEPRGPMAIDWHDDWYGVLQAMGITRTEAATIESLPVGRVGPRLFKKMHKRFLKRHKPFRTQFVLALNINTDKFLKKKIDPSYVIVTNSVDPIALRRAGYHYLWLNDVKGFALKRQIASWLSVWRPQSLRSV